MSEASAIDRAMIAHFEENEGVCWGNGRTGRDLRERIQAALANERTRPAGHEPNPGPKDA